MCVKLFSESFSELFYHKSNNCWMIVAKSFLESNEALVLIDVYKSH